MTAPTLQRRDFADGAELAPAFADWTAQLLQQAIDERGARAYCRPSHETLETSLGWQRGETQCREEAQRRGKAPPSQARDKMRGCTSISKRRREG